MAIEFEQVLGQIEAKQGQSLTVAGAVWKANKTNMNRYNVAKARAASTQLTAERRRLGVKLTDSKDVPVKKETAVKE